MRIILFSIFLFLFSWTTSIAAELSVSGADGAVGDQLYADIVANTDSKEINSVEATILYPSEVLKFVGYQDGAGVIKLWVQPPREISEGKISFAGGIPGGVGAMYVDGVKQEVFTVVRLLFKAKSSGTARVVIEESTLLLNDGNATALPHAREEKSFLVTNATTEGQSVQSDKESPLPFAISLIPKDNESGTPSQIVFSAYDSESGISAYKVKFGLGAWREAESPYPIPKRLFPYKIIVLATDSAGNETSSSIRIPGTIPLVVAILLCIVILASVWRIFMVKKRI